MAACWKCREALSFDSSKAAIPVELFTETVNTFIAYCSTGLRSRNMGTILPLLDGGLTEWPITHQDGMTGKVSHLWK